MKIYEIRYQETMQGFFEVEAENEEDALKVFWDEVGEGRIDLLDTEMLESDATVWDEIKEE